MISIKSSKEIEVIAEGSKILANILRELKLRTKPGITTKELDRVAETLIFEHGGKCSFKGYQGFPACLCTSINEVIVHGIPSERIIKEGDLLSLDLGIKYKGFHSDMATTFVVGGNCSPEVNSLIQTTKESLKKGIEKAVAGNTFGDIGNTVEKTATSKGFSVFRNLCGHGIGRNLHEDPNIFNFGKAGTGPLIKEGMTFCIEPMLSMGQIETLIAEDDYGIQTKDGSLSAHFEHTIAIINGRGIALTQL